MIEVLKFVAAFAFWLFLATLFVGLEAALLYIVIGAIKTLREK